MIKVANAPLSYGAFEMTVGTDFAVPDPERDPRGDRRRRLRGHRPRPARLLRRGRRARRAAARRTASRSSAASCPCDSPRRERTRRTCPRCTTRSTCSTPPAPTGARPVLCDAGGPERIANPGRGGEDASCASTTSAGARSPTTSRAPPSGARARLRAGLPPPHVDLRRGRAGDRALPRGHRRRAAARLRPPARRGRRPGDRRWATGASGSARSTSRTCASTCSPRSRPSAPTR